MVNKSTIFFKSRRKCVYGYEIIGLHGDSFNLVWVSFKILMKSALNFGKKNVNIWLLKLINIKNEFHLLRSWFRVSLSDLYRVLSTKLSN